MGEEKNSSHAIKVLDRKTRGQRKTFYKDVNYLLQFGHRLKLRLMNTASDCSYYTYYYNYKHFFNTDSAMTSGRLYVTHTILHRRSKAKVVETKSAEMITLPCIYFYQMLFFQIAVIEFFTQILEQGLTGGGLKYLRRKKIITKIKGGSETPACLTVECFLNFLPEELPLRHESPVLPARTTTQYLLTV